MHELINKLSQLGISLKLNGDNLDIFDPQDNLDSELIDEIKAHKSDLIAQLLLVAQKEAFEPLPKASTQPHYALSSAQQRLFFQYELNKESTAYNLPKALWIKGALAVEQLEEALGQLTQRHEILRTSFNVVNDETVQVIDEGRTYHILVKDCVEEEIAAEIASFVRPFNLLEAPFIRVAVLRTEPEKHLLLLDMHHIITDGVSQGVLVEELVQLYQGHTLPSVNIQYRDFSEWQQSEAHLQQLEDQRAFWLRTFEGEIPVLQLPKDFKRDITKDSKSGRLTVTLDQETADQIHQVTSQRKVTGFMFLLSAYYVMLAKLSNQEEVVVGTPVAGRSHPDLDRTMGVFINTLALSQKIDVNQSFSSFLEAASQHVLKAFENQYFPYESLIDELGIPRNTGHNPLFDVLFTYQNFDKAPVALPGLMIEPHEISNGQAKLDLTLTVNEANGGIELTFEYNTVLFEESTIQRMAGFYTKIIDEVLNDLDLVISEIALLSEEEQAELLYLEAPVDFASNRSLPDLIKAKTEELSTIDLLHFNGEVCSNKDLELRASHWANVLLNEEKADSFVGLYLHPGIEMVIACLSVMKAGKGFIPLDPSQPEERLQAIIAESKINLILTEDNLKNTLAFTGKSLLVENLKASDEAFHAIEVTATSSAYVLFTSGSTGVPKGVKVSHQNLINYATWFINTCEISPADKLLITSSFAFDAIYTQVTGSLLSGAQLHILGRETYMAIGKLIDYIEREEITFLKMTPTLFNLVIQDDDFTADHFSKVRMIMLGGEAINAKDVEKISASHPHIRLMNHYGPTETTIGSIARFIEPDTVTSFVQRPTLGRPITNTRCYVLDQHQKLLPPGCIGELYISGAGVALGYLNREDLTRERFLQDPFQEGARMYRTGDLVSRFSTGELEYHGRMDDQVKIGGIRMELDEIKRQLKSHPYVKDTQVVPTKTGNQLVGYYLSDESLTDTEVRSHLRSKLPEFMVPSFLMRLDAFPLTSSGKINKRLLPEPVLPDRKGDFELASNDTQKVIAILWSEVLELEIASIGIHANFFEIGGNSLKLMKLSRAMERELQREISVADLFRYPTIASLDKLLSSSSPLENNMEERVEEAIDEGSNNLALLNDLFN